MQLLGILATLIKPLSHDWTFSRFEFDVGGGWDFGVVGYEDLSSRVFIGPFKFVFPLFAPALVGMAAAPLLVFVCLVALVKTKGFGHKK